MGTRAMGDSPGGSGPVDDGRPPGYGLRERARQRLAHSGDHSQELSQLSQADTARLIEELRLYHVELTIQNEELQTARDELMAARDRFRDLFEDAPVGYLILDAEGGIRQANRTAARLFGCVQGLELVGQGLAEYVAAESQDAWYFHRRALQPGRKHVTGEITIRPKDTSWRIVGLETVPDKGANPDAPLFRCALIDRTEHRQAEYDRDQLLDLVERNPHLISNIRPRSTDE